MDSDLISPSLRAALQASPDGVLIVSSDGRIVWTNPRAAHLFGYDIADLVDQSIDLLVPGDLHDLHRGHRERYMASAVARPMGKGIRLTARRRDGLEFRVDIDLSPLPTRLGMYVICIVRDLSAYLRA